MDLFDDLPEPEKDKTSDLLQPKIESWGNANLDIFSDLPVPCNIEVNRGVKRKLDESENNAPQKEIGPLSQIEKEIKRTMAEVFKKTDEEFLKQAAKTKPSWKDGTTAIVVLVIQNILYISNLGDSKAILCRYNKDSKKYVSLPLSIDHSPTDYKERMRIQKAGGCVRDGRVMGIIEVSRSIGDGQYKSLGITSIPDIKRCQLTDDDVFILLACDGLWKVFTSEEVLQIVFDSKKEPSDDQNTEICYETACNRLVNEAIRKHSGDNVTVVIVSVKKCE